MFILIANFPYKLNFYVCQINNNLQLVKKWFKIEKKWFSESKKLND